jgi:hypothetical protein
MSRALSECEGYNTYGPATAARYGLPYQRFPKQYVRVTNESAYYPARKKGWKLVDPYLTVHFEAAYNLAGRGGKHLVVTEFENRTLDMSSEDLAEAIRDDDGGYFNRALFSNQWCRKLLAMSACCSKAA